MFFAHIVGMCSTGSHSHISCAVLNTAQGSWIIDTGVNDQHDILFQPVFYYTPTTYTCKCDLTSWFS